MKYRTTSDRRKGAAISTFSDLPSLFPFNPNPIRSRSNPNSPSVPSATSTATQLLYQTQCTTTYRFNQAFKLTAFGGVDNTISTRFVLPEMKKLSTGIKFVSLAVLLVSCGMTFVSVLNFYLLLQLIPQIFIRIYPLQFSFTREVWSKLGRMQQRNRVKSKLEELNHICTATNGGEFRFCGN
ncbi:unnamed protein product [Lactuca virosa]|uniref:DUF7651 domain-containing protein n=1 Tax=Lactuca virosa TaxID=75947 RepID=A0AAU9M4D1_9ASTR|nr:unnamed protein product [Lactuca virosa]